MPSSLGFDQGVEMTDARKFTLGLIGVAAIVALAAGLWVGEPMITVLGVLLIFGAIPLALMSRSKQ